MDLKLLDKSHTYYVYCRSGKRTIGSYNSITIKPEKMSSIMQAYFSGFFIFTLLSAISSVRARK